MKLQINRVVSDIREIVLLKVKKLGNSGRILLPSKYIGRNVFVAFEASPTCYWMFSYEELKVLYDECRRIKFNDPRLNAYRDIHSNFLESIIKNRHNFSCQKLADAVDFIAKNSDDKHAVSIAKQAMKDYRFIK